MNSVDELKATALAAIDRRRDWLIDVAKAILRNPETGFREVKTSRLVSEKLAELGIAHERGIALTGLKGYLTGSSSGPTVALLGELDSIRVPAHPNADPEDRRRARLRPPLPARDDARGGGGADGARGPRVSIRSSGPDGRSRPRSSSTSSTAGACVRRANWG